MSKPRIVSDEEWLKARKALLAKERAFTRQRDALTRERLDLPWRRVAKEYLFEGPGGRVSLADLFGNSSQLIVYHFMLGPEWEEGCKSCSLIADHYDPLVVHLRARDVTLATVSRAPLDAITAFKQRMGWSFPWVSSHGSDFNYDFQATSDPERGALTYNYVQRPERPATELPGISVFAKDEAQAVYHTYSSYSRGLEDFMSLYRFLDIVPNGRNEGGYEHPMMWVRHHDNYD